MANQQYLEVKKKKKINNIKYIHIIIITIKNTEIAFMLTISKNRHKK